MKHLDRFMEEAFESIMDFNQIAVACIVCDRVTLLNACGESTVYGNMDGTKMFIPTICMTCESGYGIEDDFYFMDAAKKRNTVESIPISVKMISQWEPFLVMKGYFNGNLILPNAINPAFSGRSTSLAIVVPRVPLKFKVFGNFTAQSVELVESESTTSANILPYLETGFF